MRFLWSSHLIICLSLETLTCINYKDLLTYSGETDRPDEIYYIFSISNDITSMINFPAWILHCQSHSHSRLHYFFLLMLVFFYNDFPSIGIFSSCFCFSFHWDSIKTLKEMLHFTAQHDYSCADWNGLLEHLEMFYGRISLTQCFFCC